MSSLDQVLVSLDKDTSIMQVYGTKAYKLVRYQNPATLLRIIAPCKYSPAREVGSGFVGAGRFSGLHVEE
jgi:hypothetical protein